MSSLTSSLDWCTFLTYRVRRRVRVSHKRHRTGSGYHFGHDPPVDTPSVETEDGASRSLKRMLTERPVRENERDHREWTVDGRRCVGLKSLRVDDSHDNCWRPEPLVLLPLPFLPPSKHGPDKSFCRETETRGPVLCPDLCGLRNLGNSFRLDPKSRFLMWTGQESEEESTGGGWVRVVSAWDSFGTWLSGTLENNDPHSLRPSVFHTLYSTVPSLPSLVSPTPRLLSLQLLHLPITWIRPLSDCK